MRQPLCTKQFQSDGRYVYVFRCRIGARAEVYDMVPISEHADHLTIGPKVKTVKALTMASLDEKVRRVLCP